MSINDELEQYKETYKCFEEAEPPAVRMIVFSQPCYRQYE